MVEIANPGGAYMQGFGQANKLKQMQMDQQREQQLRNVFARHGEGLMAGEQRAFNALAPLDPELAISMQNTHRDNTRADAAAGRQEQLFEQQMNEYARSLSAAERAAEAQKLEQGLSGAAYFYEQGDREGYTNFLARNGLDPQQFPFEQFPAHAARVGSAIETLKAFQDMNAPPAPQSPEGKFHADVNAGLVPPGASGGNQSAAEEKINRLMETGLSRTEAIAAAERYAISRDPQTGEAQLVDRATGQPVGIEEEQPQVQPDPDLTFGDPYQRADSAFGLSGGAAGIANTVADVIPGVGAPFPQMLQTRDDFNVLKESLINDIAGGYNRQPPSWLLKNIEALVPQAGSFFTGPEEAQSKLRSLGRSLSSERQSIARQLDTRALSPTNKQALESRASALDSALSRIREAIGGFDAGQERQTTPSGVQWRIVE